MQNAEVLYATLFTPRPSNTALFESYYGIDRGVLQYGITE